MPCRNGASAPGWVLGDRGRRAFDKAGEGAEEFKDEAASIKDIELTEADIDAMGAVVRLKKARQFFASDASEDAV